MSAFLAAVEQELASAVARNTPINSAHEGYAVILEELDEFWEEVRKKRHLRDIDRMRLELVQIAAMCARVDREVMNGGVE